jgi:hypothetical protein
MGGPEFSPGCIIPADTGLHPVKSGFHSRVEDDSAALAH